MEGTEIIETHTVGPTPLYSLPLRMPGLTLAVSSSVAAFQLTLKGGCDETGLFEVPSQHTAGCTEPNSPSAGPSSAPQSLASAPPNVAPPPPSPTVWRLSPLNYALGRLVYDVVWEEGLRGSEPVHLEVVYSRLDASENDVIAPSLQRWELDLVPDRWIPLPRSRHWLKRVKLQWHAQSAEGSTALPPQCEFRLALSSIPLKLCPVRSVAQSLDLATLRLLPEGQLNLAQVLGAWLVLEEDVDWTQWSATLIYTVESH